MTPEHCIDKFDLIDKLNYMYRTIYFNNKKVSLDKMYTILKNNTSNSSLFEVNVKKVKQPFYKGDYPYFINHCVDGMNNLFRTKIYIKEHKRN